MKLITRWSVIAALLVTLVGQAHAVEPDAFGLGDEFRRSQTAVAAALDRVDVKIKYRQYFRTMYRNLPDSNRPTNPGQLGRSPRPTRARPGPTFYKTGAGRELLRNGNVELRRVPNRAAHDPAFRDIQARPRDQMSPGFRRSDRHY